VFTGVVEEPDYSATIGRLEDVEPHSEIVGVVPELRDLGWGQSKTLRAPTTHSPALAHTNVTGFFESEPANQMHESRPSLLALLRGEPDADDGKWLRPFFKLC